jgi:hypothetical protein
MPTSARMLESVLPLQCVLSYFIEAYCNADLKFLSMSYPWKYFSTHDTSCLAMLAGCFKSLKKNYWFFTWTLLFSFTFFTFCWPCIMQWFLTNDQRDAQILFYVFISIYNSLYVSSTQCSSSGETDCINAASGNSHSMLVAEMCAGSNLYLFLFITLHVSSTQCSSSGETNCVNTASGTQVRGFKPGRSRQIFQGEKIFSAPSFRRGVKPWVPCRWFTACKRSLDVSWKSASRQN